MKQEECDFVALHSDVSCTGCGKEMALSNASPREGGGHYCPACAQAWRANKTPEMRATLQELSRGLFGRAPGEGACPMCGSTFVRPEDFRDRLSRKEFTISGMCQRCQNSAFGTPDEENESP